jgi:hypothetical protein
MDFSWKVREDSRKYGLGVVQCLFDSLKIRCRVPTGITIEGRERTEPFAGGATPCEARFQVHRFVQEKIDVVRPLRIVILENQECFHRLLGRLLAVIDRRFQECVLPSGQQLSHGEVIRRLEEPTLN